jgi:bacillithiol biosynthesis deacetylase BshB1
MEMPVDCLAIAAHRDDLEITSGGLIAKMIDKGYKVAMLDMTAGEMGSSGDAAARQAEADAATKILGATTRVNLHLPDAYLQNNFETRAVLAQQIRELKPQLVILPYWEQRHPDHRVCSLVGFDACFYAGLKKAKLSGSPHRPRKILYATYYRLVEPTFAVDITLQFERKIAAVKCYATQFKENDNKNKVFVTDVDIFEYMRVKDRELGMRIRTTYAEGYIQKELISVDDPIQLGGVSI